MSTQRKINPKMVRVYAAARVALGLETDVQPADLARLFNVSDQVISNWSSVRDGPSSAGLLQIQRALGVNATWVECGHGPMFIEGAIRMGSILPPTRAATDAPGGAIFALREPPPRYASWPFPMDLHAAIMRVDDEQRRRVENVLRAHLGIETTAPTHGAGSPNQTKIDRVGTLAKVYQFVRR